jgi:superfamily II RNA helicase
VLFTQLCKYDGEKTAVLGVRDFQQIAGRAGRKGFDTQGYVAAQAPEHVIENLRLEQKAGGDRVKLKRIVRKKPPDRGYVPWDRATFDRLVTSQPEPLVSRFRVTHSMILDVLERPGGGCLDVARIIYRSHERRAQQRIYAREARAMAEALVNAGILDTSGAGGRKIQVHADLQDDFSIHHALSLWLVDTLGELDAESPTYALDVLTLVESILENPDYVLRQQLDAVKTLKMAEMKMAGVEYEERIAELEKLEYPKPLRELVYDSFNAFARVHPWVKGDDVRPKSIAREMVEKFMDFNEYVREYELGRAEGTLLRYLSDAYKALVQTVPAPAKTPAVEEVEVFLRAIVRSVDSSLLDEWERILAGPEAVIAKAATEPVLEEPDITRDERGFTVLVRNALFQLVKALARRDWAAAAAMVTRLPVDGDEWTAARFEQALAPFFEEHGALRIDPTARSPQNTRVEKTELGTREVVQVLCDLEGNDDWALTCWIDLRASTKAGKPVVVMRGVGR